MTQTKVAVGMIDATSIGDAKLLQGDGAWVTPAAAGASMTIQSEVATTSGSTVTATSSLPAGVKLFYVHFDQVSGDSAQTIGIRIGDSGGIETSGYKSAVITDAGNSSATDQFTITSLGATTGMQLCGTMIFSLKDSTNNTWVMTGNVGSQDATDYVWACAGVKSLSAVITQVQILRVGGAFDNGDVVVSYWS